MFFYWLLLFASLLLLPAGLLLYCIICAAKQADKLQEKLENETEENKNR
jgi:hypothetical protein